MVGKDAVCNPGWWAVAQRWDGDTLAHQGKVGLKFLFAVHYLAYIAVHIPERRRTVNIHAVPMLLRFAEE